MNDEIIVFSVYEVSLHLKQVIETQIEQLFVKGEISNFTHHSSGHMYFNLKDENSTLRCTFFRNASRYLNFIPENGMEVVCNGKLTVYEKGGSYNLNVLNMMQSGQGDLQRQFEMLKRKLSDEGLFDQQHKQALPRYPRRIGIITSPTGAALQDITNILTRRYPVEALVYPALVQGNEAPEQLMAGLRYFNAVADVEVIILTRGGGSQEDLFCFNDEGLARAIFASKIPVISAVGHEIDFTISDLVADLRAPTPSAAAELVVPDKRELLSYLKSLQHRLNLGTGSVVSHCRAELADLRYRVSRFHPESKLQNFQQRLDMAAFVLEGIAKRALPQRQSVELISMKMAYAHKNIIHFIQVKSNHLLPQLDYKIRALVKQDILKRVNCVKLRDTELRLLSPDTIMNKGYSIVMRDGKPVVSVKGIKLGDKLDVRMRDGKLETSVDKIGRQKGK